MYSSYISNHISYKNITFTYNIPLYFSLFYLVHQIIEFLFYHALNAINLIDLNYLVDFLLVQPLYPYPY